MEENTHHSHGQLRHSAIHAVAGAFSSCIANLVCQPLDVIKIRFQVNKFILTPKNPRT